MQCASEEEAGCPFNLSFLLKCSSSPAKTSDCPSVVIAHGQWSFDVGLQQYTPVISGMRAHPALGSVFYLTQSRHSQHSYSQQRWCCQPSTAATRFAGF